MKKLNILKRKLTKKELKGIAGSGAACPLVLSCFDRFTGEEKMGVHGIQDGPCC